MNSLTMTVFGVDLLYLPLNDRNLLWVFTIWIKLTWLSPFSGHPCFCFTHFGGHFAQDWKDIFSSRHRLSTAVVADLFYSFYRDILIGVSHNSNVNIFAQALGLMDSFARWLNSFEYNHRLIKLVIEVAPHLQ